MDAVLNVNKLTPVAHGNDLWAALDRLDQLLAHAADKAQATFNANACGDSFRGLYITEKDVEDSLSRTPGAPVFGVMDDDNTTRLYEPTDEFSSLKWLIDTFELSYFDVDLLLIALAPELDLRYERLYAYLQDDVTRKRPSIDLSLNLLCNTVADKIDCRHYFASDAPLLLHDLLHLIPDPNHVNPPFLAHYCKVDDQIVRLLLGGRGVDYRLLPSVSLEHPTETIESLPVFDELKQTLPNYTHQTLASGQALTLHFHGPRGSGKRKTADALASELGMPILVANLGHTQATEANLRPVLRLLFREAWLQGAVLYLQGLDSLGCGQIDHLQRVLNESMERYVIVTVISSDTARLWSKQTATDVLPISFALPDYGIRRSVWEMELDADGIPITDDELDVLAGRFRVTAGQITDAMNIAKIEARWRAAGSNENTLADKAVTYPSLSELFAAVRDESGQDLREAAQRLQPVYTWDNLVLPQESLAQLREICQRVTYRSQVLGEWGFGQRLSLGKGVNALFVGSSGTGKTMAAEVVASALELDLYRIDLSGVVSKYIGETEKNLNRIFHAAENANAILFFDEADALFGKRSEVRDSHDRYANIETAYLLQKMEQYEGITILATNLRANLDEAFVRRLAFTVHFPFPEASMRRSIWQGIWPSTVPLDDNINYDFIADRFKLSGGNIKNVALAAAFLAAEDGSCISMVHLLRAIKREYQKLGKPLSDAELGSYGCDR